MPHLPLSEYREVIRLLREAKFNDEFQGFVDKDNSINVESDKDVNMLNVTTELRSDSEDEQEEQKEEDLFINYYGKATNYKMSS